MSEDDHLEKALDRAKLWLADYDRRHPPTSRECLDDVVERLSAK